MVEPLRPATSRRALFLFLPSGLLRRALGRRVRSREVTEKESEKERK